MPQGDGTAGSSSGFGVDDLDRLARRAVDAVLTLARRARTLASAVLLLAVVACIGGFLLGIAALSDGIETLWILLGGFFASLALATAVTALWRLRVVTRSADELVGDVRAMLAGDRHAHRTVVDTVEVSDHRADDGVVALSREFFSWRGAIGDRVGELRALTAALTAVTSFPGLVALATLISFVFVGLGVLFAISLLL